MTMIVDFADGFTSASAPNLIGLGNEVYTLLNNQPTPQSLTGLLFTGYTTVFGSYEVERYNGTVKYRQAGYVIFKYDSTALDWTIDQGNYVGDDLIQSAIANPQEITLSIDSSGQISYTSGNMDSFGYSGKLKLNLNRINT